MKSASERAMALVDGQLAPAEVPGLVQELGRNPALVAELQMYRATARRRIAEPFAAKGEEPVPARLVDTVLQAPVPARQPARSLTSFRTLFERLKAGYGLPAWSLAAGPALVAVLVG